MPHFRNQGTILSVATTQIGSSFDQNESMGATEVLVAAPYEFNEDGGQAFVSALDQIVDYTGWDSETNYLHLTTPLAGNVTTDDYIYAYPASFETIAFVQTNESDETIPARVPFSMQAILADGIRDDATGYEQVAVESDGFGWTIKEVYGKQPVLSGEMIDVLPPALLSDGLVPVISPAVTVTPLGVGALRGEWSPVPQPDLHDPVIYDVYVSATTPVVAAPENLLMSLSGTSAVFSQVNVGGVQVPISRSEPSYMAVWARDADGPAPSIGGEGSAIPVKADLNQLNVEELRANTIETLELWASSVTADFFFANNSITIGDPLTSHIEINPSKGLILYGPDGVDPVVKLDMTVAQLSEFKGKINTDKLATFTSLEISGLLSFIMSEAKLTMASSSISAPASSPSLGQSPNTALWVAPPVGFTETGMIRSGSDWKRLIYNPGTFETRVQTIDGTATVTSSVTLINETADRDARGLAIDGSGKIYTIRRNNAAAGSGIFYLKKYNADGTPVPNTGSTEVLTYAATYGTYAQFSASSADPVRVDASNVVHVVDQAYDLIRRFNTSGVYSGSTPIPSALTVTNMDVDGSGNYYLSSFTNTITKIDSSGAIIWQTGSAGSGNGQFAGGNGPRGIKVDGSGNVYVADPSNSRIQKFDSSGVYVSQFGSAGSGNGQFSTPNGLNIDGSGNIYVADSGNHRIQKFNSSHTYVSQFGTFGTGNGKFDNPQDLDIDSSGNIYVVDNQNYRIQKFNSSFVYQTEFGSGEFDDDDSGPDSVSVDTSGNVYATADGNIVWKYNSSGVYQSGWYAEGNPSTTPGFQSPTNIASDSAGNLWVVDQSSHRIQKYNNAGVWQANYGTRGTGNSQFNNPYGIAIDSSDNIYVTDYANVRKFNSSMTFISKWGDASGLGSTANGEFWNARGIAVDSSSGHVYVAEEGNYRIQKLTTSGSYVTKWGTAGSANGQFQAPYGVAVDPSGNVYVTDLLDARVQKFNSSGTYQSKFGTYGSGNGQFQAPYGIHITSGGNIYVADAYGERVQKFNSSHVYQTSIGAEGSGLFGTGTLNDLTFDPAGNMYTTEGPSFSGGGARIMKFSGAYPQLSEPVCDEVSPTIRTQPTCGWDGTNVLVGGIDQNSMQLRNTSSAGVILHNPTTSPTLAATQNPPLLTT